MSTRVACQLARVRPCAASYRQGTLAGAEHVAIFDLLYLLHSHQDYDGARTEIVSTSTISSASVASNTASCIRLAPGAFPASFSIITQPSSPHESSQQLHRRPCVWTGCSEETERFMSTLIQKSTSSEGCTLDRVFAVRKPLSRYVLIVSP